MVSFWPWKGESSSPASFEKTLSTLSKKIATTQLQLDKLRSNSRRVKVLWTLYLSFAYLVYAIVLVLVLGWQNLGLWEWSGLAGGPVLIYLIRTLTNAYFTFRIDSLETRLKSQQTERGKTIQKLKDATRYDSTQELLEKYGGEKPKKKTPQQDAEDGSESKKGKKGGRQSIGPGGNNTPTRTNLPPPPTANIQRPPSAPGTPQNQHRQGHFQPPSLASSPTQNQPSAEFAPNADDLPASYAQYDHNPGPPRWYDRILDLMLGEDETAPRNRIVLICKKCRLVNGQAPPGTKGLSEVGQWKCMSCGALNGEIDEGRKIVREVLGQQSKTAVGGTAERIGEAPSEGEEFKSSSDGDEGQDATDDTPVVEEPQPRKRAGKAKK